MRYKYMKDPVSEENLENIIIGIPDDSGLMMFIPNCETNADWRLYQAWLADDNVPEEAD